MDHRRQMKQALITNYFPPGTQGRTVGHTLEDNPPRQALRQNLEVRGFGSDSYTAHLPGSNATYGHLDLEHDDAGPWINNVGTQPQAQRAGVATQLYQAAVRDQGPVFASSAPKYQHDRFNDTRYLTSDGAAFVGGLKAQGHMKPEWHKSPY